MVEPATQSNLATRFVVVVFAALAGALAAHAFQSLVFGEASVAVNGGVATVMAVMAWIHMGRRYRGSRGEG